MKRCSGLRCTSSTSSVSAPPRSTITVAAWRGVTGVASEVELLARDRAIDLHRAREATRRTRSAIASMTTATDQKWICESCGFIYDPADGDPDGGIPPGTAFEDIPADWFCPVCGARKVDFVPYED